MDSCMFMYTDEELIEIAQEFSEANPGFDRDFVDSLADGISEYGRLTDRQSEALRRVVSRFRMLKGRKG